MPGEPAGPSLLRKLRIRLPHASLEEYLDRHGSELTPGGVQLRLQTSELVDTRLRFELRLYEGAPLLSGEGTLVSNPARPGGRQDGAPGVRLRFEQLDGLSQQILDRILDEKARRAARSSGGGEPVAWRPPASSRNAVSTRLTKVMRQPTTEPSSGRVPPPRSPPPAPARAEEVMRPRPAAPPAGFGSAPVPSAKCTTVMDEELVRQLLSRSADETADAESWEEATATVQTSREELEALIAEARGSQDEVTSLLDRPDDGTGERAPDQPRATKGRRPPPHR